MYPKVAVILAAYQGEAFIEEQLISLLWQRDICVRIYVRDDGSLDRTREIVERISHDHPGVITMTDDDYGHQGSASLNFFKLIEAIDLNAFDYIAIADQDDIWAPAKMSQAVRMMQQSGSHGYSSSLLAYDAAAARSWILVKNAPPRKLDYLFQGASAGCTYMLTAGALAQVKSALAAVKAPWPVAISHDWSIYAICRSRGLKWVFDAEAHIIYRQHGANLYGARRGWRGLMTKLKIAQNGWYADHILWLKNIVTGNEDERAVFSRLESKTLMSRIWLIRHAAEFRRERFNVFLLRLIIALGFLEPGLTTDAND